MGDFWGGDDDYPSPPRYTPPPKTEEMYDVLDKIAGVQSVQTVGPNGRKQIVLTPIPKAMEEEPLYKMGAQIVNNAMNAITKLIQYNPEEAKNFQPFIDTFKNLNAERKEWLRKTGNFDNIEQTIQTFKQTQTQSLEDAFANRTQYMVDQMAHQGYADSTAEQELKAAMAGQREKALQELDWKARLFQADLQGRQLALESARHNQQEAVRQGQLQEAEMQYRLPQEAEDRALGRQMNAYNVGAALTDKQQMLRMNSKAPLLGLQASNQVNQSQLGGYQAGNQFQLGVYNAEMQNYMNKPPSFMDVMGQMVANSAGSLMRSQFGGF